MPRIAGLCVVLLLAAAGVIAALLPGTPHVAVHRAALPAKVDSVQAVGLVDLGPPGPGGAAATSPETLLASAAGPSFTPVRQAEPGWNADQMAGGTYIFIDISTGMCLASAAGGAAVLQRCNLGYAQRWRRQDADTRGYWQLRNAGTGRCLTVATAIPAGGHDDLHARLERCGTQQDWHQRITFSPTY